MGDVVWVGRDDDMHAPNRAGVGGGGERGGSAEDRIRATTVGEVGSFHTQLIQSNNVVMANLPIGTP